MNNSAAMAIDSDIHEEQIEDSSFCHVVLPTAHEDLEESGYAIGVQNLNGASTLSADQKRILPSYQMILRMLKNSLTEYLEDPACRDEEIKFWRSSVFVYFGNLLCEMDASLFGRVTTLADLRRGAERKLGLDEGALLSDHEPTEEEIEDISARTGGAFQRICETVGNLEDPEAEKLFAPVNRKRRRSPKAPDQPIEAPSVAAARNAAVHGTEFQYSLSLATA